MNDLNASNKSSVENLNSIEFKEIPKISGPPMPERHRQIVDLLNQHDFVSIDNLSKYFQVTPQTIRRDISKLSESGLLQRYHGGISRISNVKNIEYKKRKILQQDEKISIAKTLVKEIPNQASVFINIGTTTEEVAKALLNHTGLKVITNNLNVAMILSQNDDIEVIIAGGIVRNRDLGITGDATIDFIKQFKVDIGIIGISGIDQDGSLLDFDYNEVRVARTIINNSRRVFLAADHSKFDRNAMVSLCHINEIDSLFTDKNPTPKFCQILDESSVTLYTPDS